MFSACNSLYSVANPNLFIGCPTVPNLQVIWRINFEVPAGFPSFNNARVRCKKTPNNCRLSFTKIFSLTVEIRENNVLEFCADVTADLL